MPKQEWIERAARAAAAFGTGRDMFDEVAARVLGLNRTDLRILSAAHAAGTLSAGALATQVGLSPAATTEAVQRLIARGYLTRDTDPADRRRAVIATSGRGAQLIEQVYAPLHAAGLAILEDYTEDELRLITGFLERGRQLQVDHAARVRALQAETQALP
ncbi:DNA-binding transcriptional regulator, MarR family [Pseudonocardia thermophila]|jgi:Transcriptional regulators|uniref:DNA-binding transcriptional regulator, MarR family n=1 Tax=Pseudonocardia thermophila TaxID=1848 RepID=A0A1M6WNH3_PSETH|nr:MarR family transcriptional regulator [Pseudonocardia thermophila]SHK95320.1 DNA-binding transcriptional regulator, MarR family [Pseudonocardia thermophila]